jgi:hypothetical protein
MAMTCACRGRAKIGLSLLPGGIPGVCARREPTTGLGAGPGLAAYERPKVPAKRIHVADGFEYAVKIPANVLDAAAAKLIDADRDENCALALR